VSTRPSMSARSPPADSQRPAPYHPRHHDPTQGVAVTRHQRWFTGIHPFGLPLTCSTQSERVPLGFPLGFAPGHYWPRTPGREPVLDTDLTGVTSSTSSRTSNRRNYSQRATSCRNSTRHLRARATTDRQGERLLSATGVLSAAGARDVLLATEEGAARRPQCGISGQSPATRMRWAGLL
jgi:hypothetical protein